MATKAPSPLAKFSPPRATNWLIRPRLDRLVDDATRKGVAWIAAEPGAGKSTLAAAWCSNRPGRVLWYRVDEADRDPAVAFAYFTQLAAQRNRRVKALPAYRQRNLDRLDIFARSFFRAFFGAMPAGATLVLDDAHAARGSDFDVLVSAAIREAPIEVAFVILSRSDPSGMLLEEATRGAIQMLQPGSLAFTADEAIELLRDHVDATTARRLHAQSDGWVSGMLSLAQRPATTSGDISRVRNRIDSYFIDHVLAVRDPAERAMLAAVSLLPQIDARALERMGFDASARVTLEQMHHAHSFVTRLDRQPPSWRLHDLLRDALRSHFDSFGDVEWRREMRVAAGQIAAEQGCVRDAVQLYLDAGDVRTATDVAERFARDTVKSQRRAELDAIAVALGERSVEASLPIQIALGENAWQRNDARAAVARFERAIELVDQGAPSQTGLLIAATALGAIFNGWQDFSGTKTWKARLAFHLPARHAIDDPNEGLRIDSVCLRSADMLLDTTLVERNALAERILATLRSAVLIAEDALAASEVVIESAGYHLSDERLFTDVVEASAPWLAQPTLAPLSLAGWLVTYAPLGRRWPTPAIRLPAQTPIGCLELALAIARECGGQSTAFSAALFLANLAIADNDRAAAQKHLTALREIFDPNQPTQRVNVMWVEGNVLALSGEWTRARVSEERALEVARKHDSPISEQWSVMLTLARIEIAGGDPQKARDALLRTAAQFEGMRRDFALILADVASATHELRVGGAISPNLTKSIIRRASEYAWPGFGTLLAPIAAQLCSDALKLGFEPEFVRHVISERRLSPPTATTRIGRGPFVCTRSVDWESKSIASRSRSVRARSVARSTF